MSDDNIRNLFPDARKSDDQGFFSVFDTSEARLDLRWADGFRCSLPYMHLHAIRFTPADGDGNEEILLHYPAFSVVRIVGRELALIYDALNNQRASWIREKREHEEPKLGEIFIRTLEYTSLNDWQVEVEALKAQQAALIPE